MQIPSYPNTASPVEGLPEAANRSESRSASLAKVDADDKGEQSNLRYMPGLDVIRGIAILMVVFYHGLHGLEALNVFNYGAYGVHLFFVLSGFLITGILLDSCADRDYYKNFYIRRVLRILPAYLVLIAVLKASGIVDWRYIAVCLLYFCNMTGLLRSSPEYGPLWSLSVEEQFYMAWPVVVRKVSRRGLAMISWALIGFIPLLRFLLQFGPASLGDITYKTYDVADFFGAGALLALTVRTPAPRARLRKWVLALILAGIGLLPVTQRLPLGAATSFGAFSRAVYMEPWLLLFSGMILFAVLHPAIAKARAAKPLIYLANISYGLYLCHQLIFDIIARHWKIEASGSFELPVFLRFLVEFAASIAVSDVSRRTLERFFLLRKPKHNAA
jgi:peptidoglycan/LPS O-acetylase OafA/YrhL